MDQDTITKTAAPAADDAAPADAMPADATFRLFADNLPTLAWIARADGYIIWYNRRWHEYCGTTPAEMEGWGWQGVHDPETLPAVMERWTGSIATGHPFEMTFPLRGADGRFRPFLTRVAPSRDASGQVRWWFGINTDVSEQHAVAEQNELLSRELSHRIKNIFAVITGVVMMATRARPDLKEFAREITARIAALGRAHEFARPHSDASRPAVDDSTLKGLLTELLRPYPALDQGRIIIAGDDVPVDDRGATPLALLFHELATNAAKYGALSAPDGRVDIAITAHGDSASIVWTETGGPAIAGEPAARGFGTQLAQLAVERQLGGVLTREWRASGLRLAVQVQCGRLIRSENG